MLTKLEVNAVLLGSVVIACGSAPLQAASLYDTTSPYRLNGQVIKHSKSNDTETGNASKSPASTQNPQLYQLDYKYRALPKSAKIKAELPAAFIKTPAPVQAVYAQPIYAPDQSDVLAALPFANEITLAAKAASLDPSLVHAVIYVESRYRHRAISPKGAVGLMQVLPDTAARYGLRDAVHLPRGNIKAGTLYLRDLMAMFDNRIELALAAYNAGEGAVKKYAGQIPPYPETRHYVKAVMAKYALNGGMQASAAASDNATEAPVAANATIEAPLGLAPVAPQYVADTGLVVSGDMFSLNADAVDH